MDLNILWEIPLRTFVIYLVVLGGLRITGKRQLGQMTPFDLVLLLLIANAVQNAMTGPDTSLLGGILSALTLLFANQVVSRASNILPGLHAVIIGKPTTLIQGGELLKANLAHEEISEDELLAALREHGVEDVSNVAQATLEVDGSISVVLLDSSHLRGRRRAVRFIKSQH